MFGSPIAMAHLKGRVGYIPDADLQTVIAAVELQVLRRESQHIDIFRTGRQQVQPFLEAVVVMKERAAGAVGKLLQYIAGLRSLGDGRLTVDRRGKWG